jgi:ABC-2 type transport system ATP-binding protein
MFSRRASGTVMSEPLALGVDRLSKHYANGKGVHGIDLAVPRRSIYCLLGPNGSGKTTTMAVLAGWYGADGGSMTLGGAPVTITRPGHRVGLGFVPDEPILDDRLTGWEWASYVAAVKDRRWPRELSREVAVQLVLDESLLSTTIGTMSLGSRRKVALWIEFVTTQHLLLLDEPLTGLDPHAIAGFQAAARGFSERGGAVLMSTHLVHEAEALATHAGIIADGRTVIQGRLADVRGHTSLLEAFRRLVPV